jgi:methionyl aminopeptidase
MFESSGFSLIKHYIEHGIVRSVHEDPDVPNFGKSGIRPKLVEGLVLL